jgi:adenylate cyclase class 2
VTTYEVEIKFRVLNLPDLVEHLQHFGCELGAAVEERDWFYQHPQRDFTQTDECLRLRHRLMPDGSEEKSLTYKGPRIDQETKTRRELEIRILVGDSWEEMLEVLGFSVKASIRKFRRYGELRYSEHQLGICVDCLPELGSETFVELETFASEADLAEKRALVIEVSKELGLTESIQTSYLGLLTQAHGSNTRLDKVL